MIFYFCASLPVTKYLLSGEKPASRIVPVPRSLNCPVNLCFNLPSNESISTITFSVVPSMMNWPSGENFICLTSADQSWSSIEKIENGLSS